MRFTIYLLAFLMPALYAQAQDQQVVKGKVTDKGSKKAIQHVSVSEVDADGRIIKGTSTDIEGNFVLKLSSPNNKLSISYIGFKTVTQAINGRTTINIALEDANNDAGSAVIVATRRTNNGFTNIADRDLTTATAKINAKDLEEMPAVTIDQALQGRLAGVDITASSGDPGAAMSIRIRGTSSINSNGNPLIVVDGMPFETTIPSDFNFGTADEAGLCTIAQHFAC